MSKYTSTTITGFNATPPSDDGTQVDSNKVKWQTHLDKLATPVKNLAEAINTALISHFDIGPVAHAVNYTILIADYGKTLEASGTITLTMGTLAALGAGFIIRVKNVGAGIITIDGASAETIDGNLTIALDLNESVLLQADAGMSDWLIISRIDPVTRASLMLDTTDAVTFDSISVTDLDVTHTAAISNDHASEIVCDAAGFGGVRALDVEYLTGAITALTEESVLNLNINRASSISGSNVMGVNIDTTSEGSAIVHALRAGAQVDPINHSSGSFANPTFASNNTTATDVAIMRDGSNGTTTSIMVADNDYIIIGAAAAFGSLTLNLTTLSSQSINPEFFFSISGTDTFTEFFPTDGTDGLRQSGVISWDPASLTGHVADTATSTFNIKIVRTRNGLSTAPILGHAESANITTYGWDKDAIINCVSVIEKPPLTSGTSTAYTANVGITAYVTGTVYKVRLHTECGTGVTIALDGLSALAVEVVRFSKLTIGDMKDYTELYYDGTVMVLQNPKTKSASFTIALWDGSFSPSEGQAYSSSCQYSKKSGDMTFTGTITITDLGTLSGNVYIGGLPFSSANLAGQTTMIIVTGEQLSITAGVSLVGRVDTNTSRVQLFKWSATTGMTPLQISDLTATSVLGISGSITVEYN